MNMLLTCIVIKSMYLCGTYVACAWRVGMMCKFGHAPSL